MERIIAIAQQLTIEGKTPTTALVKARLPKNIPLATIIQGIQKWKSNPSLQIVKSLKDPIKPSVNTDLDVESFIEEKISAAMNPILDDIKLLKKELSDLKKKNIQLEAIIQTQKKGPQ